MGLGAGYLTVRVSRHFHTDADESALALTLELKVTTRSFGEAVERTLCVEYAALEELERELLSIGHLVAPRLEPLGKARGAQLSAARVQACVASAKAMLARATGRSETAQWTSPPVLKSFLAGEAPRPHRAPALLQRGMLAPWHLEPKRRRPLLQPAMPQVQPAEQQAVQQTPHVKQLDLQSVAESAAVNEAKPAPTVDAPRATRVARTEAALGGFAAARTEAARGGFAAATENACVMEREGDAHQPRDCEPTLQPPSVLGGDRADGDQADRGGIVSASAVVERVRTPTSGGALALAAQWRRARTRDEGPPPEKQQQQHHLPEAVSSHSPLPGGDSLGVAALKARFARLESSHGQRSYVADATQAFAATQALDSAVSTVSTVSTVSCSAVQTCGVVTRRAGDEAAAAWAEVGRLQRELLKGSVQQAATRKVGASLHDPYRPHLRPRPCILNLWSVLCPRPAHRPYFTWSPSWMLPIPICDHLA